MNVFDLVESRNYPIRNLISMLEIRLFFQQKSYLNRKILLKQEVKLAKPAFACSKLTIETLEKGVKYV